MYDLQSIPLFSTLSDIQLTQLQSEMHIHKYEKDSIVFYEGDESEYLYVLLEGSVRLYKTAPKGNQIHMHNFHAPEVVAIFVAFENLPFPATCELLADGYIGLLPLKKFHACLENATFSSALVKALSRRMKLLANLLHKETIYSSEAKIADILHTNPSIFTRLKNTEIAYILNMTPETLSRILTKLKREQIIMIDSHVVTVLNQTRLENILDTNFIK